MTSQLQIVAGQSTSGSGPSIGRMLVDSGVLGEEDVERISRVQNEQGIRFGDAAVLLGLLTEDQLRYALSRQFNYSYLPSDGDKPLSEELIAAYQPFGQEAERFRALRNQVSRRWFDHSVGQNALAVLGCERGVGRSYLVANLAIAFAQMGERTLVIDADMRNPRQQSLFRLENNRGLSMLLSGRSDSDGIQSVEGFGCLSVMTAGPTPPNPQELLAQPVFKVMLDSLGARFDIILVDTAAMDVGHDAQLVAQRTGGAMVIARKNETRMAALGLELDHLQHAGVALLGCVYNAAKIVRS